MDDVTIRLMNAQDLEPLCQLYFEFHEFHVRGVPERLLSLGDPGTFDCSELCATLQDIMRDDDAAIFVALTARQLLGLAEVYLRQDEPHPARVAYRYGYLQSLLVRDDFRQRGIGARLLDAAQRWAKEKGATEMRLETWEFAGGPQEFYEHNGYHTLRRTLAREL
jgi:GNAT superfamily N-acetyltransferase